MGKKIASDIKKTNYQRLWRNAKREVTEIFNFNTDLIIFMKDMVKDDKEMMERLEGALSMLSKKYMGRKD